MEAFAVVWEAASLPDFGVPLTELPIIAHWWWSSLAGMGSHINVTIGLFPIWYIGPKIGGKANLDAAVKTLWPVEALEPGLHW
jgi:hypothetical protein